MKILLKNVSNTYNYGSMMMAENLIYYLNSKISDLEFYIQAYDSSDIERLKTATEYKKIYLDKKLSISLLTKNIKYVRVIEKNIRRKRHISMASNYYDSIIVLGGDDFSEIYYSFPKDNAELRFVFDELIEFNKKSRLYMIGQTIGPYTGTRIALANKAFQNIKIYTRDKETTEYMKETFNIETNLSRDLAFLDLKLQSKYWKNREEILSKYNIQESKYITIVGTGLIKKYCLNEDEMIDAFYLLIKSLKQKYKKYKIVCLSHVYTPDGINDHVLYDKINKKYDNYIDKNCIVINNKMLPVEARIILGCGCFTITCRMHAAISTFQMLKPAICISYSKKYNGVIGDGLNMQELIINAKDKNIWKNFSDIVLKKIEFIEKSENLKNTIKENVQICQKIVKQSLNEIVKDLQGN